MFRNKILKSGVVGN